MGRLENDIGDRGKAKGGAIKIFVRAVEEIIQRPCHSPFHSVAPREQRWQIVATACLKILKGTASSTTRSSPKVIALIPVYHQWQEIGPALTPSTVHIFLAKELMVVAPYVPPQPPASLVPHIVMSSFVHNSITRDCAIVSDENIRTSNAPVEVR